MRALFATTGGIGHLGPLVPFAHACLAAGHEVVVAAPASFADEVARVGLTPAPVGEPSPELLGRVFARLPQLSRTEADEVVVSEVFGRLDAQAALPGLRALTHDWRPDVVVREPAELASLVAAEEAGLPHAQVAIGMTEAEADLAALLLEPLGELAELADVDADRVETALLGMPRFSCVPASVDDAAGDLSGDISGEVTLPRAEAHGPLLRYRADVPAPERGLPAAWGDPECPLVYVTFGSVAATAGPFVPVYAATLEALADQPLRVLMTTGSGLDPAELGPVPAHVHVERWWPQHEVLPHAAAVVGHGGFGTTMAALASGVPQVVVPLFALDQFVNAAHVEAVGAGVRLVAQAPSGPPPVERLPGAVEHVLATPSVAQRARQVADQMAEQVPVAACVGLIEELAGV